MHKCATAKRSSYYDPTFVARAILSVQSGHGPWPKRAANLQDCTPPPSQKDHAKLPEFLYSQRCACMCKIPDILSGPWTQASSTPADACSCEGQPHANDNRYSAVRLFPQANITNNSQTTRIQGCSSRTYTPISPSMSASICFRRAILR